MENKIKNNLFFYATSELSQDAFICYLMSFLLKDAKEDSVLQACAKSLLVKMVPKLAGKNIVLENVERQIDHMDVLLTVISEEEKYKIVVEDKINTSEHSNQLLRYLDIIHKKYPEFLARGVYYKTGFQSDLSVIEEAGYQIITRSEMLDLLAPLAERAFVLRPDSPRAMDPAALCALLAKRGVEARPCASVEEGLETALSAAGKDGVICALGSLYLCGALRSAWFKNR